MSAVTGAPDVPPQDGVLRSATETAERERVRLLAGRDRAPATAVVARLGLRARFLGTEEAARSGLRYQPVVWSAIAIVAIAFFWPGRNDSTPTPVALSQPVSVASPTTTTVVSTPPPTTLPFTPVTFTPIAVTPLYVSPSPASTTTTTTTTIVNPVPLSVRGFGWANSLSGSGVGSADVPAGTMPVAARLGRLDKASFVRLTGTATSLVLHEDRAGAREAIGAAAVVACAIVDDGWSEKPDQSFGAAPKWDAKACVDGHEADNVWTFDLSAYPDRAGSRGFALVPAASGPADFQITFKSGRG